MERLRLHYAFVSGTKCRGENEGGEYGEQKRSAAVVRRLQKLNSSLTWGHYISNPSYLSILTLF